MKEALFKVKAALSDYVNQAEQGDVIEITRHGKTSAVLIGMAEYSNFLANTGNEFMSRYLKWKQELPEELIQNDFQDVLENIRSKTSSAEERYLVW